MKNARTTHTAWCCIICIRCTFNVEAVSPWASRCSVAGRVLIHSRENTSHNQSADIAGILICIYIVRIWLILNGSVQCQGDATSDLYTISCPSGGCGGPSTGSSNLQCPDDMRAGKSLIHRANVQHTPNTSYMTLSTTQLNHNTTEKLHIGTPQPTHTQNEPVEQQSLEHEQVQMISITDSRQVTFLRDELHLQSRWCLSYKTRLTQGMQPSGSWWISFLHKDSIIE